MVLTSKTTTTTMKGGTSRPPLQQRIYRRMRQIGFILIVLNAIWSQPAFRGVEAKPGEL